MNILSWNIQATKGCDDVYNPARIIDQIKDTGNLDVICLQEVARHIPSLGSEDQLTLISSQFPTYAVVWAPGFSVPGIAGQCSEFGNLTLIKKTLLRNSRVHSLPSPKVEEPQIPRTMAESIVAVGDTVLALFNTHLAFHSSVERVSQIRAITRLRDQVLSKSDADSRRERSGIFGYVDHVDSVLLCGDLNISLTSNEYAEQIRDQQWLDCWERQPGVAENDFPSRQPTCGCFDRTQWQQGPHVRDYFLATSNIAQAVTRVSVDVNTDASDHQPVLLELAL